MFREVVVFAPPPLACACVSSPGPELGSTALRLTAADRIIVIDVALLKYRVPAALGRRHHLGDGDTLDLP